MKKDLKAILDYLNEQRGLDFSGYHSSIVERRIKEIFSDVMCKDCSEYLHYIKEHPDTLDKLFDALTINVSRFFRNALTFEYIAKNILPLIFSKKIWTHDYSLRIWSAACSTGEEPYSLAILLNELLEKEDLGLNLNIFATDIDKQTLKKAQEGVYSFEQIENVKYGILKKYFIKQDESFRLSPEIKKMVNFSFYDILDKRSYAPPESVFANFDMVFCRNLLIYYNTEYQELIFDKLYHSLAKNGYLILGDVERPTTKYQRYFKEVCECCYVYQKR
ncbi:MAG: protein-glutamate O-methyltransferase CheR [Deltaproteobacteria bacterium]|nr:protein-glutamate O-methyltransferase CheR [Deltaproteobacteria bacterium]